MKSIITILKTIIVLNKSAMINNLCYKAIQSIKTNKNSSNENSNVQSPNVIDSSHINIGIWNEVGNEIDE